jgi:predicted PurR-regulated permease PerM
MKREHAENYFFLIATIVAAVLVALIFWPELTAIVLGITFAVLFLPLYNRMTRGMPRSRTLAALLIVFLAAVIVFAPLTFIGIQLFGQASSLYAKVSSGGGLASLQAFDGRFAAAHPSLSAGIDSYLQQFFGWVATNVGTLFSGLATALFSFLLSLFALYYFLRDGEHIRAAAIARLPLPKEEAEHLLLRLHEIMGAIVRGTLLMAVCYGLAGGVGFFIFGLPNGAFWGAVMAFLSFIPAFGMYIVIVPGAIVLALGHHYFAAIGLFVWIGAIGILYENFLRPNLIGHKVHIHPLLVLFSVIGGLSVFGPLGILLGPLALGVLLALLDIYPVLKREQ